MPVRLPVPLPVRVPVQRGRAEIPLDFFAGPRHIAGRCDRQRPIPSTVLDDIPALAAWIRTHESQERTPDVDYARA